MVVVYFTPVRELIFESFEKNESILDHVRMHSKLCQSMVGDLVHFKPLSISNMSDYHVIMFWLYVIMIIFILTNILTLIISNGSISGKYGGGEWRERLIWLVAIVIKNLFAA